MSIVRRMAIVLVASLAMVSEAIPAASDRQPRPAVLGTSGGNVRDTGTRAGTPVCCTGTLGSLVQDARGRRFVLSNNHVLARSNRGHIFEGIMQPGLADEDPPCVPKAADRVASLWRFKPITFGAANRVDAAIAVARAGAIDPLGTILDIGTLSDETVAAMPGMAVKKTGRTTGLTHGTIAAVDATIFVGYSTQCGGAATKLAMFTHQIRIGPGTFSGAGDSGSLIVEDCAAKPRAVGLLFAGGVGTTFANPIGDALTALGVHMVGTPGSCGLASDEVATRAFPRMRRDTLLATRSAKRRAETQFLAMDGVVGVGVGHADDISEEAVIEVYVTGPASEAAAQVPETLEGHRVRVIQTGDIVAF